MAEFCLDCMNKILGTNDSERKYVLSKELELCEECGEWKRVIVTTRRSYYIRELIIEYFQYIRDGKNNKGE